MWLLLFLPYQLVAAQGGGRCECVPGGSCDNQPYGAFALDISLLGLYPPCPILGYVRCCSRAGLEELYKGMLRAIVALNPATKETAVGRGGGGGSLTDHRLSQPHDQRIHPNHVHTQDECGCIPRGICMPHLTQKSNMCRSGYELCCLHTLVHTDVLVNIFGDDQKQSISTQPTGIARPQPVFKPHNSGVEQHEAAGRQSKLDMQGLPCLSARDCRKVYGHDALDVAKFGVLPPCSKRGYHRCVEPGQQSHQQYQPQAHHPLQSQLLLQQLEKMLLRPKAVRGGLPPTQRVSTTPTTTKPPESDSKASSQDSKLAGHTGDDQHVRFVPCVPYDSCIGSIYNPSNKKHVAKFGDLAKCSKGMLRCIFEVDLGILSHVDNVNLPIFTPNKDGKNPAVSAPFFQSIGRFNDPASSLLHPSRQQETTAAPKFRLPQGSTLVGGAFSSSLLGGNSAQSGPIKNKLPEQTVVDKSNTASAEQQQALSSLLFLQRIAQQNAQKPSDTQITQPPRVPTKVIATPTPLHNAFHPQSPFYNGFNNRPASTTIAPATTTATTATTIRASRAKGKSFFSNHRTGSFFSRMRKNRRPKKNQNKSTPPSAVDDSVKAQFDHFNKEASIKKDAAGNLVISGGQTVVHLPPGIAPPGAQTATQQNQLLQQHTDRKEHQRQKQLQQRQQQSQQHQQQQQQQFQLQRKLVDTSKIRTSLFNTKRTRQPKQPSQTMLPQRSQHTEHEPIQGAPSVFFDPNEAPQVVEALKNSKKAVIQVQTDDNQRMVLNVRNDQLLSILQALNLALNNIQ